MKQHYADSFTHDFRLARRPLSASSRRRREEQLQIEQVAPTQPRVIDFPRKTHDRPLSADWKINGFDAA